MIIGNKTFEFGNKVYIMGILNVTPDSFSDGGKFNQFDQALKHAEQMIQDGADIIDIGGESTRPGHTMISDEEEISRVAPIIEKIKQNFEIPVSVDTYKGAVAEAALQVGADLLNDIWGFLKDERIAKLAKEYNVPVCLMHNRENMDYKNYISDVLSDMQRCLNIANKYQIDSDKIILDPGIGFAKTYEQNLILINHLEEFCQLGYPVLLGTSRKSVIGLTLDLPVTEREEGTLATSVIGALKGCDFVRVHDVKANKRALDMTRAIMYS